MTKIELFKFLIDNDLFKSISFFNNWCEIYLVEGKNKIHLRMEEDDDDIEIFNRNFQFTITISKLTEKCIRLLLELGEHYED